MSKRAVVEIADFNITDPDEYMKIAIDLINSNLPIEIKMFMLTEFKVSWLPGRLPTRIMDLKIRILQQNEWHQKLITIGELEESFDLVQSSDTVLPNQNIYIYNPNTCMINKEQNPDEYMGLLRDIINSNLSNVVKMILLINQYRVISANGAFPKDFKKVQKTFLEHHPTKISNLEEVLGFEVTSNTELYTTLGPKYYIPEEQLLD